MCVCELEEVLKSSAFVYSENSKGAVRMCVCACVCMCVCEYGLARDRERASEQKSVCVRIENL